MVELIQSRGAIGVLQTSMAPKRVFTNGQRHIERSRGAAIMECPKCGSQYKAGEDTCATCGYRLSSAPSPQSGKSGNLPTGTVLRGRYEITSEHPKERGMGVVYFALDRQAENKPCVVKQVKEPVTSEEILRKLQEEARRMASLSQAIGGRLPEILEDFVEDGRFHVVQQRIPGKSLEDIFSERSPLEESEVVGWGIQCCRVLQLIHDRNLLHRDISPDNLMLTPMGDIMFIDFGTLRELKRIARGTAGIGKFGFTPAEQWQQKPVPQSDIFALGATIYFLLTGFIPISNQLKTGGSPTRTDYEPAFPPIREKRQDLSPRLESVLCQALDMTPSARYASANVLRAELERISQASNATAAVTCPNPKCGHKNEARFYVCERCEAPLYPGSRQCPRNPKHQVPANATYCTVCGAKMG